LFPLEANFKEVRGSDWKPNEDHAPAHDEPLPAEESAEAINSAITSQCDLVRKMWPDAEQPRIDADVK
jgi:hypothetical protein